MILMAIKILVKKANSPNNWMATLFIPRQMKIQPKLTASFAITAKVSSMIGTSYAIITQITGLNSFNVLCVTRSTVLSVHSRCTKSR